MTRNRQSAKQAGAYAPGEYEANFFGTGECVICRVAVEKSKNGRYRKYCSHECLNAARMAKHHETKTLAEYKSLHDRLVEKIDKSGECWLFTGSRNGKGYGLIRKNQDDTKRILTHRAAYELFVGPIPEGAVMRHKCDNPPCCNPDHLEPGTVADNFMDSIARDRYPVGERSQGAKLTNAQVEEIRAKFKRWRPASGGQRWRTNAVDLAEEYGVNRRHIAAIALGKERPHG